MLHQVTAEHFRGEVHSQCGSGVKVRHTFTRRRLYVVKRWLIRRTSVAEQKEVAKAVDDVRSRTSTERLETIYTQKLANLDELKQSLLQKAFTGQLTARELASI